MPATLTTTIKRQVFDTQGNPLNVEISAAGVLIRKPRGKAFLVPWGNVYQYGGELEARRLRVPGARVSRGLLHTSRTGA